MQHVTPVAWVGPIRLAHQFPTLLTEFRAQKFEELLCVCLKPAIKPPRLPSWEHLKSDFLTVGLVLQIDLPLLRIYAIDEIIRCHYKRVWRAKNGGF